MKQIRTITLGWPQPAAQKIIPLAKSARVLSVDFLPHAGGLTLIVEAPVMKEGSPAYARTFKVWTDGDEIPDDHDYVGSVYIYDGRVGFHLYELLNS